MVMRDSKIHAVFAVICVRLIVRYRYSFCFSNICSSLISTISQILTNTKKRISTLYDSYSQEEFLQSCTSQYAGNDVELEKIKDFEDYYELNQAIFCDLHQQLNNLYQAETRKQSSFTVYRDFTMPIEEFEKLPENTDGLITMNTFLSMTFDRAVALIYAGNGEDRLQNEFVLFEIHASVKVSNKPFAGIRKFSYMQDEEPTLLTLRFYLTNMGDFDRAKKYSLALLKQSTPPSLSPNVLFTGHESCSFKRKFIEACSSKYQHTDLVYNNLGLIKYKQGDYESARQYYDKVIVLNENFSIPNNHVLGRTYSNIGLIDLHAGQTESARCRFKQALDLFHDSETADNERYLSTLYNNLGSVYQEHFDFDKSVKYYTQALYILLPYVPENHPDVSGIYNNLDNVYLLQDKKELALTMLNKSLELSQKSLPSNHLDMRLTLNNIGTVFGSLNVVESSASDNIENAIDVCSLSIDDIYVFRSEYV
ncbi:hypothetical protein I4U23_016774 [Adineta vaga]|nr:hypothetical protein I4U23_016774 [Adineta vaga]